MQLSQKERRHLRGLAHRLKPVLTIGTAGLTDAVVEEARRALSDHQLIKVRVAAADRGQRDALIEALCERSNSALVTRIGRVAVIYKPLLPPPLPPA